jgi:hypothetical protein
MNTKHHTINSKRCNEGGSMATHGQYPPGLLMGHAHRSSIWITSTPIYKKDSMLYTLHTQQEAPTKYVSLNINDSID